MNKAIFSLLLCVLVAGCAKPRNEVVIYTSLDQVFSEPVLQDFERETGIKVRAVYDVEATKTTGMVNRLIAEKDNPQADVFWNSETARTIILKKKGVLTPYFSLNANDIPKKFKDRDGYWTGFAARARVLIYNRDLLKPEDLPNSIFDFTNARWNGRVALANPLFGTTATQAAALFVSLGGQEAERYFRALRANNVIIVDGNSTSRDRVQDGEIPIGLTDTDDANVAILGRKPVDIIFPDQGADQIGTLFIPNTVCLIKDSPHPANGKRLIDYILRKETESKLAFSEAGQIPLRDDVKRPANIPSYQRIKTMDVDFEAVADMIEHTSKIMQDIFIR
ncbi:MAG: extracellular solute-binding protein [Candidatus Omnitrophota bacterium]